MFYTMLNTMTMLAIVMSVGYYLQKTDVLSDDVRTKATTILLDICMPSLFLMALQIDFTDEILKSAITMIIVSLVLHSSFLILSIIFGKIIKADNSEKGIITFSSTFKNTSYMGLPIVASLFPDNNPAFYMTLYCIPFNILAFSIAPKLLPANGNQKIRIKDFLNNINIAVIIGLILFFNNIKIPSTLGNAFNTISQMCVPLSLFLTGALLAKSRLRTVLKEPKTMLTCAFNLLFIPIVALALLNLAKVDHFTKVYAYIMATLPAGSLSLILTDRYNGNVDFSAKIVLSTTFFSLFTAVLLIGLV